MKLSIFLEDKGEGYGLIISSSNRHDIRFILDVYAIKHVSLSCTTDIISNDEYQLHVIGDSDDLLALLFDLTCVTKTLTLM